MKTLIYTVALQYLVAYVGSACLRSFSHSRTRTPHRNYPLWTTLVFPKLVVCSHKNLVKLLYILWGTIQPSYYRTNTIKRVHTIAKTSRFNLIFQSRKSSTLDANKTGQGYLSSLETGPQTARSQMAPRWPFKIQRLEGQDLNDTAPNNNGEPS